jgi:hypothetical protein
MCGNPGFHVRHHDVLVDVVEQIVEMAVVQLEGLVFRTRQIVVGLVYVAAFAPDQGESALSLFQGVQTPPPLGSHLVVDASGFFTIDQMGVEEDSAEALTSSQPSPSFPFYRPLFPDALDKSSNRSHALVSIDTSIQWTCVHADGPVAAFDRYGCEARPKSSRWRAGLIVTR